MLCERHSTASRSSGVASELPLAMERGAAGIRGVLAPEDVETGVEFRDMA